MTAVAAVAALVLAGAAALSTSGGAGARDRHGVEVSYDRRSQVLAWSGPTFDGGTFDSASLGGRPTVVNFYASWCTVCDRELPDFERVSTELGDQVQFVGVNPQSNDSDAAQAAMVARGGVTYPTVRDAHDDLLREFSSTGGLPVTLFVDGSGVVRDVHHGLLTEQQLRTALLDVLGVRA